MQQDGFDISLFPKKDTPSVSGDFDVTLFPKKIQGSTPDSNATLDLSLFPKKAEPEKKKTVQDMVSSGEFAPLSMADIYASSGTPPSIGPEIDEINPLSKAFYLKPPDIKPDQVAATPEAQFRLQQEGEQIAQVIRQQENENWNKMTAEEKQQYISAAMGDEMNRASSYGNLISGTVFKLAADLPKWSGAIAQKFDKWITGSTKPVEAYSAYYTGMKIQEMLDEIFPTNRKHVEETGGILIQGAASMIPYVFAGSWVAGITGVTKAAIPSAVAVGVLGAAQNSVPEYDKLVAMHRDAHQLDQRDFLDKWAMKGKSTDDLVKTYNRLAADTGTAEDFAWSGFIANSLTGVTEGLSMGWGMNNIQKFLGPGWTSKLVTMLEAGGMEGFQESLTEYVANMSAIQAYDFSRRWYDNVAQSGGVGALMGIVTFGIAGGLSRQLEDPNLDPRKKAIIMKAIEENEKVQDILPEDPNAIVPPKTSDQVQAETEAQDKKILENQRRLGLSGDPVQAHPNYLQAVLDNAKKNKTSELEVVKDAEEFLYSEYKRIAAMRYATNRQVTMSQIQDALDQLDEQLRIIVPYRQSLEEYQQTRVHEWDIRDLPQPQKKEESQPQSTEKVRKKQAKHVVETVENPPQTPEEKKAVKEKEAKLLAEEKATLGNPDARPVVPVEVDPTPVAEEPIPEGSKKQKPARYFSVLDNKDSLTKNKRKDSNFEVSKEGEVDIIEGKESTIIAAQAYNPLYESTNIPQSPDDAIHVVSKPVIDPKTGEVLKRGELYFGDVKPTKKQATADMVNREMVNKIQSLLDAGEITYTDEDGNPCAKTGGRGHNFTRGSKWTVVKDLKGMPSHEQGGVDLQITKKGVTFKNNKGMEVHAAHGLLIIGDKKPKKKEKSEKMTKAERDYQRWADETNVNVYPQKSDRKSIFEISTDNGKITRIVPKKGEVK